MSSDYRDILKKLGDSFDPGDSPNELEYIASLLRQATPESDYQILTTPYIAPGTTYSADISGFDNIQIVWAIPYSSSYAVGNYLLLKIDNREYGPCCPGLLIKNHGGERINFVNYHTTQGYIIAFAKSNGDFEIIKRDSAMVAASLSGVPTIVQSDKQSILFIRDYRDDKNVCTPVFNVITGTGSANNQLFFTPSGGKTLVVTDLHISSVGSTYVFGLFKLNTGGSPQTILFARGGQSADKSLKTPITGGGSLYVDITQAGAASVWYAAARGYEV